MDQNTLITSIREIHPITGVYKIQKTKKREFIQSTPNIK